MNFYLSFARPFADAIRARQAGYIMDATLWLSLIYAGFFLLKLANFIVLR